MLRKDFQNGEEFVRIGSPSKIAATILVAYPCNRAITTSPGLLQGLTWDGENVKYISIISLLSNGSQVTNAFRS